MRAKANSLLKIKKPQVVNKRLATRTLHLRHSLDPTMRFEVSYLLCSLTFKSAARLCMDSRIGR